MLLMLKDEFVVESCLMNCDSSTVYNFHDLPPKICFFQLCSKKKSNYRVVFKNFNVFFSCFIVGLYGTHLRFYFAVFSRMNVIYYFNSNLLNKRE